ncbi:MAG: tsaB, partial [Gammaproteobacteria bacterium]|nr:tsaB [Gammaproteobacteria bacterium]
MKILGFDTSSAACSVALLIDDKISVLHEIIPMQQAQSLLPMIEELLLSNKMRLDQLDAIAFGCGPGSFTGVRIAASVAQGLAYALQLPVIPISSLAALAQAVYQNLQWQKLLVAVDARMQEVYWGAYHINQEGIAVLIHQEAISTPEKIFF